MILIFNSGFKNYPIEPSTPNIPVMVQCPTLHHTDFLPEYSGRTNNYISNPSGSGSGAKYQLYLNSTDLTRDVSSGIEVEFKTFKGNGTKEDPYLISRPGQLDSVRYYLDKHFKQIADLNLIDYSLGSGWNPIGDGENAFTGTYDGKNHKIINLSIDRPSENYTGLFGYINNSIVKNFALEIVNITGNEDVGGLVGSGEVGDIIRFYSRGNVTEK